MPIDLNLFLESLAGEKLVVKKIAAKAVLNFRQTRDEVAWNEALDKIVALGIPKSRIRKFFLNV